MKSGIDPHEPPAGTVPPRPLAHLWQALALTGMVTFSVGLLSACVLTTEDPVPEPNPSRHSQRYARGPEERRSDPNPPHSQRYARGPEERRPDPEPPSRYRPHASQTVDIPPGHLPPPGACRIWFPDRPPRRQPPPGDCYVLRRQVPPGATLVYGR